MLELCVGALMLNIKDLKIGDIVKCTYPNSPAYTNKIGIITDIGIMGRLEIKFENFSNSQSWYNLSCLELVTAEKEKSCRQCNKINETGVSVCWNCAIVDP